MTEDDQIEHSEHFHKQSAHTHFLEASNLLWPAFISLLSKEAQEKKKYYVKNKNRHEMNGN